MSVQLSLNVVTLVMCVITLSMATAALMPQIKAGLLLLRDLLLWTLLVGILGFVTFWGWFRLHQIRSEGSPSPPVLELPQLLPETTTNSKTPAQEVDASDLPLDFSSQSYQPLPPPTEQSRVRRTKYSGR